MELGLRPFIRMLFLGALLALFGSAQAVTAPTPEQLRMFQQLPPAQRDAALKMLTEQGGTGQTQEAKPLTEPETVTPRPLNGAPAVDTQLPEGVDGSLDIYGRKVEPELALFGYDLFAGQPTTFAPATDIPVPLDYIIGPGDTVQVQLFGKENVEYTLVVTREGILSFPGLGPITVVGLSFNELQKNLHQRIAQQMIGIKASISMGALRSIRVFVLGDAYRPGSYTVSALSTMTNALFVSGGIKTIGSLRDIQLKRNGKIVARLDLYDLLLNGDTSSDARLQPGDVIFIPSIGKTVGVAGEVRRPAIYELKKEKTVNEALRLAGDILPTAYPKASQLERINGRWERTLVNLDLSQGTDGETALREGDVIRVYSVLDRLEDTVLLSGHVERPGGQQWREGMRLTDLIPSEKLLLPKADLNYLLIRRELPPDRRIEVISANLGAALQAPGSPADIALRPRDEVTVFNLEADRSEKIKPLLDELRLQADQNTPAFEAGIGGRVRAPGAYPLEKGMRISDLIRAGGQLQEAAYTLSAELTRYTVVNNEYRETEHVPVNLAAVLIGDINADIELRPHDYVNIKDVPRWREQEQIEIRGEVKFPGVYPIQRGETLSAVLQRAGGLTEMAFPNGSVFTREELRAKEQQQLDTMAARLESDLAAISLEQMQSNPEAQQSVGMAKSLLGQLRATKAAGRLVINLPKLVAGDTANDIVLKDGDKLFIPKQTQEVSVIGEVQYATSHVFSEDYKRDDYINRSGGMTYKADDDRIYIVRANGEVVADSGSFWSRKTEYADINPGDTIVVPLDAERMRPLTLWTSITQIVYQLGLAAAAFNAIGAF